MPTTALPAPLGLVYSDPKDAFEFKRVPGATGYLIHIERKNGRFIQLFPELDIPDPGTTIDPSNDTMTVKITDFKLVRKPKDLFAPGKDYIVFVRAYGPRDGSLSDPPARLMQNFNANEPLKLNRLMDEKWADERWDRGLVGAIRRNPRKSTAALLIALLAVGWFVWPDAWLPKRNASNVGDMGRNAAVDTNKPSGKLDKSKPPIVPPGTNQSASVTVSNEVTGATASATASTSPTGAVAQATASAAINADALKLIAELEDTMKRQSALIDVLNQKNAALNAALPGKTFPDGTQIMPLVFTNGVNLTNRTAKADGFGATADASIGSHHHSQFGDSNIVTGVIVNHHYYVAPPAPVAPPPAPSPAAPPKEDCKVNLPDGCKELIRVEVPPEILGNPKKRSCEIDPIELRPGQCLLIITPPGWHMGYECTLKKHQYNCTNDKKAYVPKEQMPAAVAAGANLNKGEHMMIWLKPGESSAKIDITFKRIR